MEDFERRLDQIATEYKQSLENYDYNNELTLEVEKGRATIEQLNQLVARERETSEELKKKMAEEAKLSEKAFEKERADFLKETASLKTKLKGKVDRNNELTLELEKSKATIQQLTQLVAKERETSNELRMKKVVTGALGRECFLYKRTTPLNKELEGKEADDCNKGLTLELERNRATIQQLNQLVARERETSEELKKKVAEAEVTKLSFEKERANFLKEMASLKKELKGRDDCNKKDGRVFNEQLKENDNAFPSGKRIVEENQEIRVTLGKSAVIQADTDGPSPSNSKVQGQYANSQNSTGKLEEKLDHNLARMNESLQTMYAEILRLKTQVKDGGEAKTANAISASSNDPAKTVELHRYFNASLKDHFCTTNWTALQGGKDGYVHEGVVGRVFLSHVEGTVPLFSYWNGSEKNHLYMTELSEVENARRRADHVFRGICCYIFSSPLVEGTRPLFRYYSSQSVDYFLTTDDKGMDGYTRIGILGYVY